MTTKFMVQIRCKHCNHKYKRVLTADDENALAHVPDPPCPKCRKAASKPRGMDLQSTRAPAVGGSQLSRAVDYTAEITMQDHGLTDLRDNVKEGEIAAPKLPAKLQRMADGMFAPRGKRAMNGGLFGMPANQVIQAAVNGRFNSRDTPTPQVLEQIAKPQITAVAGDGFGKRR